MRHSTNDVLGSFHVNKLLGERCILLLCEDRVVCLQPEVLQASLVHLAWNVQRWVLLLKYIAHSVAKPKLNHAHMQSKLSNEACAMHLSGQCLILCYFL